MVASFKTTSKFSISPSIAVMVSQLTFSVPQVWLGSSGTLETLSIPTTQHLLKSRPGNLENRWILKSWIIIRSSTKHSNRNVFVWHAIWGGVSSCMNLKTGNACPYYNTSTTWSLKSMTYRSIVTIQIFLPDTEQISKKKDSRIKGTVKPHQAVAWEHNGWVWYSRRFDVAQMRIFCLFTSPCSEKWTSSVHVTFSTHCGMHRICAIAHVAKFCLAPESAGNNWWNA